MERQKGIEVRHEPMLGAPFMEVQQSRPPFGIAHLSLPYATRNQFDDLTNEVQSLQSRLAALEEVHLAMANSIIELQTPWWTKLWRTITSWFE